MRVRKLVLHDVYGHEVLSERFADFDKDIYFIGDLHLDHGNIIKYRNRPFQSVEEMNNILLSNWNETVAKDDVVFFLGDMSHGRGSRKTGYWKNKLNGYIIFIKGGHDRSRNIKFYDKLIMNVEGNGFLLVHNPYHTPNNWDGWVIHGHKHDNPRYPLVSRENKTINVSAEVLNYRPISLDELLSIL